MKNFVRKFANKNMHIKFVNVVNQNMQRKSCKGKYAKYNFQNL